MEGKGHTYRKMLAFLGSLGADLAGHDEASLATTRDPVDSFGDMSPDSLLHYQRVLEATIDNRDEQLMDNEAMRGELAEVVRERFQRGFVADKTTEAREFRARLASIEPPQS